MFSSEAWLANPGVGFYNGVATTSVRFEDGDTPFLAYTPGSAGDRRKWVWAAWIKRGNLGVGDATLFGSVNAGTSQTTINIENAGTILVSSSGGDSAVIGIRSTTLLRDTNAWYHLAVAVDTTQATAANRVLVYLNGSQVTEFTAANYPAENSQTTVNEARALEIGRYNQSGVNQEFDGYLAEVNFTEGVSFFSDTSATANSSFNINSFGEAKFGVWIPINTGGLTFGDNGFRLQFKQVGVGTASTSTIGADTSGKTNHLTSSGIVASDCAMPDSPENNFCTYNPLDAKGNDNTYSEGNLKVVVNAQNQDEQTTGTFGVSSGKWYWEHRLVSTTTTAGYLKIGLRGTEGAIPAWTVRGTDGEPVAPDGSSGSSSVSYTTGSVIGVYLDMDNGKWYVSVDGSLQNSANLTNGTGFLHNNLTGELRPFILNASSGGTHTGIGNFGQDSTFGGLESAGGYSDSNGQGDFHSSVTSPYLALCSANLPEPTIGPNSDTQADDYFNTVLWDGNATAKTISGVGFAPDWVWLKSRTHTDWHNLFDTTRGANNRIVTNENNAEEATSGHLTAFNSDGFVIGTNSNVNRDGKKYVAWNWKANGGTTTTNDASSTSVGTVDSVFQANQTAGFSIVSYTGTGEALTVKHGLNVAPDLVIVKNRSITQNWIFGHSVLWDLNVNNLLLLNTTSATITNAAIWNNARPTASVFSVGADTATSGNGNSIIAYCFHSVEGFSKHGGYTGNGSSADGTYVHLGFRPAFVMVKGYAGTDDWIMMDNKRSGFNSENEFLDANNSSAESNGSGNIDFLSNGFKTRSTFSSLNYDGGKYIYMAFGSSFKYANAR